MPPKAPKVEPLSPDHWEKIPPPVDQELWKRYMYEDDSDSGCSDTETEEQGSMAGPSSASKNTKSDGPEARPKLKNDLIKDVLDDSFNDTIYSILNGASAGEATSSTSGAKNDEQRQAKSEPKKPKVSQDPSKDSNSAPSESKPSHPSSSSPGKAEKGNGNSPDLSTCPNCSLPRLKHPRIGLNSRPPPDPSASYCANEPPVVLAGHDVHGNAFPGFKPKPNNPASTTNTSLAASAAAAAAAAAAASKTAKSKPDNGKSDKKAAAATSADTSSPTDSQDSVDNNNANAATPSSSALPLEYPTIKTPQMRCPNNCGQWKAVNVMAKHLDACLLGKGRRAGREARERIGASGSNTNNNNGSGTPVGEGSSRAGTPKPGLTGVGAGGAAGGVKRGRVEDGDAAMAKSGKKQKKGK